jgi:hypothetical protein
MFSVDTAIHVMFKLQFIMRSKDIPQPITLTINVNKKITLISITDQFREAVKDIYNSLILKFEKEGKKILLIN